MVKILVVLPYSGAQIGGGLAVVNEQLTKALAEQPQHDVKLLTFELDEKWKAKEEGHGRAEILFIPWEEAMAMKDPGNKDDERKRLHDRINLREVILGGEVDKLLGNWKPDYILGHSRFSGPAAILLKEKFKEAKVGYFLHSYPPVEGILLSGYEAFEEPVNVASAQEKLKKETEWIQKADVAVAMGPLLRWGATLMLEGAGKKPRVHEVISGVELFDDSPAPAKDDEVTLLLVGRASAAVKGFQDIVLAALKLRNAVRDNRVLLLRAVCIKVLGMGQVEFKGYFDRDKEWHDDRTANYVTVGDWTKALFGEPLIGDMVRIEVLAMEQNRQKVLNEYRSAHGILTAAYLEHFGLVPFEALGVGRPVLVSELSGAGQFLASRYPQSGKECVVEDFTPSHPRPLTNAVLKSIAVDAFDKRPKAWQAAIQELVNGIDGRAWRATQLKYSLGSDYTMANFAQAVVAAFDGVWDGKITRQIAGGKIEEVPEGER